jgi:hypothetical protein
MRHPAADKLEITRLVEQSPLPARRTLSKLGSAICRDSFPPRSTVYNIFRKFQRDGVWEAIWAELHGRRP